jgi:hypothetical protein
LNIPVSINIEAILKFSIEAHIWLFWSDRTVAGSGFFAPSLSAIAQKYTYCSALYYWKWVDEKCFKIKGTPH